MKNIKIGIVVADMDEYKPLAERIEKGDFENYSFLKRTGHKFNVSSSKGSAEVYSLFCGIGKVNAAAAAAHFKDIGCDVILNYGLSGGISSISRGELTLCSKFVEHDFDLTGIGYKPCEKPWQEYVYDASQELIELFSEEYPYVKNGTAVSGDRFICDAQTRDELKENFGAMSCDMETAAIAYVCAYGNIPFMALRRVSDDAGEDAAGSYREMNDLAEAVLSDLILDFIPKIIESDVL